MASMVSLLFGKGFSVVRTESLEQTAQFITVMCKKLDKEKAYMGEPTSSVVQDQPQDAKLHKMDKITPDIIHLLMLSQIPYVNYATAEAVLSEYKTIPRLTAALEENLDCLSKVRFLSNQKKISSKSVGSIQRFLKVGDFSQRGPYGHGNAEETNEVDEKR
jgi:ERCC4-type nuclease